MNKINISRENKTQNYDFEVKNDLHNPSLMTNLCEISQKKRICQLVDFARSAD